MAYEAIAAVASYVYEAFVGASAVEGAGAAAEVGSAAASEAAVASAASTASTATYVSAAATAASAAASYQSSRNQQASAEFNAGMSESNAQTTSMQAGAAEEAQRRKSNLVLGEQRAAFAQSGVDPSSGSGLLVQQQSATNAELDALNIRYQGLMQSRGLLAQAGLDRRQGQIFGQNAAWAGVNGALATEGTLLSGKGNYMRQRAIAGRYGGAGGYG